MNKPISSLDDARQQNPDLAFGLYAFEPGGPVTLEIHTPDGEVYSFAGATEAETWAQAFPQEAPQAAEQSASIFD